VQAQHIGAKIASRTLRGQSAPAVTLAFISVPDDIFITAHD
jgi:hypothetical protein